ncbi:TPA: hypothetical protein DCX15_05350 [bacterium]|nr:hypothetical protein [bacterium]
MPILSSYGINFFENIRDEFWNSFNVVVAKKEGKIVAASLLIFFKKTIEISWEGWLREYANISPIDATTWGIIRYGYEKGFLSIDHGRSAKDSGTYLFKKGWGTEIKPLYYQYYLNRAKEVPRIHPTNPRYRLYINTWKRLPLWLARRLGPKIIRYIH